MEDQSEMLNQREHGGKVANWKRKGKLTEHDRLKKRQKELQIMKMSQEWDARRHKRRMDRIQWLQQRRNNTAPSNQHSERTSKNAEVSSNEFNVVLAKANSSPVSKDSGRILNEENRDTEVEPEEYNRLEQKASGKRIQYAEERTLGSEENRCTPCETNQEYKSVVVKTERQDSDRFCNSNESKQALPSNSKNSYRIVHETNKKRRKEDNQNLYSKTSENQFCHSATQANESNQGSPYQRLVTMVNAHTPGLEETFSNTSMHPPEISNNSVIVQAMKQSGLDEHELEEPNLLMASEPVRFEDVLQRGGTNIQRLETRTVDIMKQSPGGRIQEKSDKASISRPHSRDSSIEDQKRIRKVESDSKNQAYPKIKQCYSLIGGYESSRTSPLSSPTSTGNPTASMASTTAESFTDKNEGRLEPVAQSPTTSGQPCPPSGYLVPIYKPSADEVVYAFVPNSGDRSLSRTPDPGKIRTDECYTESDPRCTGQLGYSSVRGPTATIHHGRNLDPLLPRVGHSLKLTRTELHHPTNVTWVNAPISSYAEKRETVNKGPVSSISGKTSAHEQLNTSVSSQRRTNKHSHRESEMTTKTRHNPSPVVTMVNGYSPAQTAHAHLPTSKSPALRSNLLDSPSNDSINNPTAIYVRPKLVPREIIVPHQAGSGNVPIVEYIKTDAICAKDLGSWTAKNVADFIAATDCSESAKIFIEQDIDGKAVLLLSQNIFVNRLNLKLGTAIKLYNHIANLRTALLM